MRSIPQHVKDPRWLRKPVTLDSTPLSPPLGGRTTLETSVQCFRVLSWDPALVRKILSYPVLSLDTPLGESSFVQLSN